LSIFEPLYESGPKKPDLARILGEINLQAGRKKEAEKYYREAIKLNPADYKSYLSLFFASSSKFTAEGVEPLSLTAERANRLLKLAAHNVGEDDFEGCYLVGMSYQSIDSLDAARAMLLKAYGLKPEDTGVLFALAGIEEKTGHFSEAEKYLEKLYGIRPDDPTVNNFYGYLLAEMGQDLERAEKMVKKALQEDSSNGYYMDSLGWIYYQRGEYDKALIELEKASKLVSDDPIILEHLGDAYRALKRYRKALAAYEKSKGLQGVNSDLLDKIKSTRKGME
jgi:tetratricopeptide (TPR) repeat protein